MSERYCILNEAREVVLVDKAAHRRWIEAHDAERFVARTQVGGETVSTVFLRGAFFYPGEDVEPFETLFTGDDGEEDTRHCATWAQAEQQHAEAVRSLKAKAEGK